MIKTPSRDQTGKRAVSSPARVLLLCLGLSVSSIAIMATQPVAQAQDSGLAASLGSNIRPDARMLLESDDITYDFDNDLIIANGTVQVIYDGNTVEADKLVYDRKNGKLVARGNVIMTEPNGNVIQSQKLELSEDFANVFANTLQIDTPKRTRLIAESATRDGKVMTLENGVYTVYTRPTKTPNKAPLWRIRANKIVHNEQEKLIEYEDASLEFFGAPVAYMPYLSMPDPSVKRKSGFLMPDVVISNTLGYGLTIPYYWALSPHYDLLTRITPMSKQGALVDIGFRHKMTTGNYSVRAAGLYQMKPSQFKYKASRQRFRGGIQTKGSFNLSPGWTYGWDVTYKSDRAFFTDYTMAAFGSETSQVYLHGASTRNSLDVRAYHFSLSQQDYVTFGQNDASGLFSRVGHSLQAKQPIVLPVIDYKHVFDEPVLGGELTLTGNSTTVIRPKTDAFRPTKTKTDRFRGVGGTFTRVSMQADWRRTFIDPIGQVFTPFAYVRGDLYFLTKVDKNVGTLSSDAVSGRVMPAVGLEYKYPFLINFDGGHQIIEPIAQVIVRPDEQRIGQFPNEDAQSLVFDTSTLFQHDKFSGFDRTEGGTRVNLGLRYKLQLDDGYFLSALFGRSFQLSGKNSFEQQDIIGTAANSGLASRGSDYVGSVYLDTYYGVRLGAQGRFDDENFHLKRLQVQATATYGPVVSSLAYAFLGKQPDRGVNDDRREILASSSLKLGENWRAFGSLRYDLKNKNLVRNSLGVGYDDEGFSLSLSYSEDHSRYKLNKKPNRTVYLRFGLRTLGSSQFSRNLDAK